MENDMDPLSKEAASRKDKFVQRFMAKVEYVPGIECWRWIGGKNERGYGQYRSKTAHRAAYAMFVGEVPPGVVVRHKCDNPWCVRPDHLELGNNHDNMGDAVARGRSVYKNMLNDAAVIEIRRSDKPNAHFAEKFGVSVKTIQEAREGSTWAHVDHRVSRPKRSVSGLRFDPKRLQVFSELT